MVILKIAEELRQITEINAKELGKPIKNILEEVTKELYRIYKEK